MSSLKLEISCETCVRVSPWSFDASGIDASWLSDSRAWLRCCLAASRSTCPAGAAEGCAADGSVVWGAAVAGGCSLCGVGLGVLCGVALGAIPGCELVALVAGAGAALAASGLAVAGALVAAAALAADPAPGAPLMDAAISVT